MNDFSLNGIGMTSLRTRERLIKRLVEEGISSERVLELIANTPRHLFVDEAISHRAYEDTALPIGMGQTISQPYIVAKMSEILEKVEDKTSVLEIGTGCGYQTSILAQIFNYVYTIERIYDLQKKARATIRRLKLRNIRYRHGDGFEGWPESAPFNAIIVTAAPTELPANLVDQLAEGGTLVIPIGDKSQQLNVYVKEDGKLHQQVLEDVMFVPMLQGATK